MSDILRGLLEPRLSRVVKNFSWNTTNLNDIESTQDRYIRELSDAIAVSVQEYLQQNVRVIEGQNVQVNQGQQVVASNPTTSVSGQTVTDGTGKTITRGLLNAP